MNWFTGVVVYVLIWWTVLFAVLPIGTHPVEDADQRTGWRGTPEHPRLLMKVMVTTLVAGVVWFGAWLLITSDYISFRHGWFAAPQDWHRLSFDAAQCAERWPSIHCANSEAQTIHTVRGEAPRPPTCRAPAFPPQTWPAPSAP